MTTSWFEQMAAAMKDREKCLNAIGRWQASLAEAEARIAELAAHAPQVVYGNTNTVSADEAPVVEGTAETTISGLNVAADA